jgi:hypothetical protein
LFSLLAYLLFELQFIGDTALASLQTPGRTFRTVFVVCSLPPCLTFDLKLELLRIAEKLGQHAKIFSAGA